MNACAGNKPVCKTIVHALAPRLRRIVKDKGAFPNDSAIFKPLWLVGAPVDFFLLEAAPQALHIHIVEPAALVVSAPSEAAALSALETFEATWSEKYAAIAPLWRKDWARLAPFFDYPPAIRKAVYTTNAVESLNYSLRRIVKDKGAFPNDEAIFKLLWLGLREASKKWKRPIRDWKAALNQFVIPYGDRVPIEQ